MVQSAALHELIHAAQEARNNALIREREAKSIFPRLYLTLRCEMEAWIHAPLIAVVMFVILIGPVFFAIWLC